MTFPSKSGEIEKQRAELQFQPFCGLLVRSALNKSDK